MLKDYLVENSTIAESDSVYSAAQVLDPDRLRLRLVVSDAAGNGKTLLARRLEKDLEGHKKRKTLQIQDQNVSFEEIIDRWQAESVSHVAGGGHMFHVDIAANVTRGVNDLLFSLAVLGGLQDDKGKLWLCSNKDYYLVEMTVMRKISVKGQQPQILFSDILPKFVCPSPVQTLESLANNMETITGHNLVKMTEGDVDYVRLLDRRMYETAVFQRPFQYLSLFDQPNNKCLESFNYTDPMTWNEASNCLNVLLKFCPLKSNPSWAELVHFASFLNAQLEISERSIFCDINIMGEDLPGIKSFVVRFLIQMSKDFATRSVVVSDQSQGGGFSRPLIERRRT